jgi:hypothetical protein
MNLNDLKIRASDLLWDVTHDTRKLGIAAFIVFAIGVLIGKLA